MIYSYVEDHLDDGHQSVGHRNDLCHLRQLLKSLVQDAEKVLVSVDVARPHAQKVDVGP